MGEQLRQDGTIHSIQLLRSIAATLVVLFHTQQTFAERVSTPLFAQEGYLFGFGAVGVHIFFVISGFIMVLTSCQPGRPYDARKFFRRRLLRIYPIYWLCVIAYVGVHAWIGKPYKLSAGESIGALLLWPDQASLIIGPAWTLTYEMFFYLCFGLAMLLTLTRGLIVLGAVFLGLIAVGHFLEKPDYAIYVITNPLLLEFLAGTAIGWLAQAGWLPTRGGAALTALGVALFGAGIAFDYTQGSSVVLWGIPSAILVMGLVSWETASGASPWVRRVGRLGDSSYTLYLIHILVITVAAVFCQSLQPGLAPAPSVAAVAVALVAIVLAEGIHRGLERPMLAMFSPNRSLLPRRPDQVRPPSELR